jgi:acyl-phosphate glycerol 3-phosphate acyltransferase
MFHDFDKRTLMEFDSPLRLVVIALVSYILGSFPTAVVVSRLFFGFDIRTRGSGNMGSTNAFRVLGWKWGLIVQVVDVLKGLLAVTIVAHLMVGQALPFTNRTLQRECSLELHQWKLPLQLEYSFSRWLLAATFRSVRFQRLLSFQVQCSSGITSVAPTLTATISSFGLLVWFLHW